MGARCVNDATNWVLVAAETTLSTGDGDSPPVKNESCILSMSVSKPRPLSVSLALSEDKVTAAALESSQGSAPSTSAIPVTGLLHVFDTVSAAFSWAWFEAPSLQNRTTKWLIVELITDPVTCVPWFRETKRAVFSAVCEASKPLPLIVSVSLSDESSPVPWTILGLAALTAATCLLSLSATDQVPPTVTVPNNGPAFVGAKWVKLATSMVCAAPTTKPET